jgi:hypothetical protein
MKGRGIPLNLLLMIATMTPTNEPTTYVDIIAKYSLSGLSIRPAITAKRISPAPIFPRENTIIRTTRREYMIADKIFVNPKLIVNILVYIEIG